jgi:hypothetical protein
MKTSSVITFLAFSVLSFFVFTSDAKGLKQERRTNWRKKMMSSKRPKPQPSPPAPSPSPPVPAPTACEQSCERIVQKPFIQCNFLECAGNFECQNLNLIIQGQNGFKSQVQCNSFCVNYVNFSCPQGFTTTSSPTSRCLAARCT